MGILIGNHVPRNFPEAFVEACILPLGSSKLDLPIWSWLWGTSGLLVLGVKFGILHICHLVMQLHGSWVRSVRCHFVIGHFVHQQMTAAGLGPGACHYVITHRAGQSLVFPSGRHLISRPRPRVVKCRMHVTSFKRSLSSHGTSQNLMRGEEFIHFWFPEILKQKFLQHVLRIQYKVNASTSTNYHRIFDKEF